MGNQYVRCKPYQITNLDMSAGDTGINIGFHENKNCEPRIRKPRKIKNVRKLRQSNNKTTKSLRTDLQKIKNLFDDNKPILLVLLTTESNRHFRNLKPYYSNQNYLKPCGQSCRRVKSNPCANFCHTCNKNR